MTVKVRMLFAATLLAVVIASTGCCRCWCGEPVDAVPIPQASLRPVRGEVLFPDVTLPAQAY